MDAQVVRPEDPELAQLLNRFVPVRLTSFKGVDMSRFRFDYDLTFAVLLRNADGHTYARYGTNDHKADASRLSIPALKRVMKAALARHAGPEAKTKPVFDKPFTAADYPAWAKTKMAQQACYHCHYANDAKFVQLRADGKFTKEMLFQYPLPENIGVALDVDRNNVVKAVLPGSPAEKAGIKAGDAVIRAEKSPVLSSADLQFVLNAVADPGRVTLQVTRGGKALAPATLDLPKGWRRYDISWRPSQGAIPPIIGIWEQPLTEEQKRQRGLPAGKLALRVSFLFPGEKWVKARGDLKVSDVIFGVNGKELPHMTPRQFHSWFRLNNNVGDTATLNVLRGDQRIKIEVPCLDQGEIE